MVERNDCLKIKNGNCQGCPVFDHAKKLIDLTVPWQEAVDHVSENHCPPGMEPTVNLEIDKNGFVTKKVLEGEEICR